MDNENQDVEVEKTSEEVENQDNSGKVEEDKAAKTVEKLQKRLGKLTGDKHDLEEELANAKAELEAYKSGKKTVEKLSEEDKTKKRKDVKDKVYTMIQERDIEFYVDRRDAGETNQELYNLFLRMFEICDSQTFL